VIGEITRQAQAIGLDQGGAFAKNLSVRRRGQAIPTIGDQNGSRLVDLSKSTVDAKSPPGLKGAMQSARMDDIGPPARPRRAYPRSRQMHN